MAQQQFCHPTKVRDWVKKGLFREAIPIKSFSVYYKILEYKVQGGEYLCKAV